MEMSALSSRLQKKMLAAREVKEANFPGSIVFTRPTKTTVISLTGRSCQLNCAHCNGKYLEQMLNIDDGLKEMKKNGSTSCLLSGGCDYQGEMKIDLQSVIRLSRKGRINAHLGLIGEEEMGLLTPHLDCVSFDFLVDDQTIKDVYHLERTGQDYIETYQMIRQYVKVIPHICIGLQCGQINGEYRALDELVRLGAGGLVFIVFIPTKGTLYADCPLPALEEVLELMIYARQLFPEIPIHLGCMRPGGRYRGELDYYAVELGINKIVNPTPLAVKRAEELGYQIIYQEECCVL